MKSSFFFRSCQGLKIDFKKPGFGYANTMKNHKVLLICLQPLLSEGLERIFHQLGDVELIRLQSIDFIEIEGSLRASQPQVVVIAGQEEDEFADRLIAGLLKSRQNTPIVWIGLENNVMRVYSAHTMPASSSQLIAALHQATMPEDESKSSDGGDANVHS